MDKKLIVIKVGTSSLTRKSGDIDREKITNIVDQICSVIKDGVKVVLVTSGAIAAGFSSLGYRSRPSDTAAKQASAAVGQGLLMEEYTKFFAEHGYICAQILLTRDDFTDKRRYNNAFSSLDTLLSRGAVPVINENDTIAVDELHLGDNDVLAAQVAAMLHADELILLTDTDGLYTKNPARCSDSVHIDTVDEITPEIISYAGGKGSANSTGGMITKIRAASLATKAGVPVFICSSKDKDVIKDALALKAKGTYFRPHSRLKTRLQWMAFYAPLRGNIYIDEGAEKALVENNKSLLAAGIMAAEGDFSGGDVVRILSAGDHRTIARGIASVSKNEINDAINNNNPKNIVAVHKDDIVVIPELM